MASKQPATRETIQSHIQAISHNDHFLATRHRALEQELRWFVNPAGIRMIDGVDPESNKIVQSDEVFATTSKLKGNIRTLGARTLIAAVSINLPREMTKRGVEEFFEYRRKPEARRVLGFVAINEPGSLIGVKTETEAYIQTDSTGLQLATEGLDMYLNNPDGLEESAELQETVRQDLRETRALLEAYNTTLFDNLRQHFSGDSSNLI